MLVIRCEQIAKLDAEMETAFICRLAGKVENELNFKSGGSGDIPDLKFTLEKLVERARRYGLGTEFEIAVYVIGALMLGDDFDKRSDWHFGNILKDEDTAPQIRAARLRMEIDRMHGFVAS